MSEMSQLGNMDVSSVVNPSWDTGKRWFRKRLATWAALTVIFSTVLFTSAVVVSTENPDFTSHAAVVWKFSNDDTTNRAFSGSYVVESLPAQ